MKYLMDFLTNTPLWAAVCAWAIAQALKVVVVLVVEKRFDIANLFASGGMPSSHSAFVMALCTVIGVNEGLKSPIFAVAAAFALVVMYDACGVRRAVGEQAKVLNRIIQGINERSPEESHKVLKVILGHSPFQVIMGAIEGILVGLLFVFI